MNETLTVEKYNEICEEYGNMLREIASTYSFRGDDFESCKSIAIWKAWANYIPEKSQFVTFLYVVMRRECNVLVGKRNRRRKIKQVFLVPDKYFSSVKDKKEVCEDLQFLPLEILNEKERRVISLVQEGYTYEQIGEIIGGNYSSGHSAKQTIMCFFKDTCKKLYIASEYRKHRTKLVCGTRE